MKSIRLGFVFVFFGAISCSAVVENQSSEARIANPEAADTQSENKQTQAAAKGIGKTWLSLLKSHGEGQLPVKRSNIESASVHVTNGELVVFLQYHVESPTSWTFEDPLPIQHMDYKALAQKLGATRVGAVPEEFKLKCGENHGGDFEVNGLKYGIYISGFCHHIRIFDVNADAVRLLLGEEFVTFLDACAGQEIGPMCRTQEAIRVGAKSKPEKALAEMEFQSFELEWNGAWLHAQTPSWANKPIENIYLLQNGATCIFTPPAPVDPNTCGLVGAPFVPAD